MKKSKRPVFKLNTSELPKGYKQPIKPKKRKGHRGPRRIVRSRRRNEFIPEGADWCEINGQKLRQDIFFGEKRGRKFIPGRLLGDAPDFFVPSVPEGAGTELLEAPYGDGGDGGACGCACEGCVCGEGEGCACTGPGTDSDTGGFGQGYSEGGNQGTTTGGTTTGGGFDNTTDATGMFGDLGPAGTLGNEGTLGDTFGSQGQSLGDTFGDLGTAGTFGTEGTIGGTFGSEGQSLGDMLGDLGPAGTIGDNFGQLASFGPDNFGQNLGDVFGPETNPGLPGLDVNPDIAERGTFDPFGPSQYSFMDDQGRSFTANPDFITNQGTMNALDGQTIAAGQPGGLNPLSQDLQANPLSMMVDPIDPQNINVAPLNIGPTSLDLNAITAMERGQQPETARGVLDPIDPQQYQGPFQPSEPDARSAAQSLMEAIGKASENFVGKAGAETLVGKDQTQFPGVASPLSNQDFNQGNLNAAFNAMNAMNTQQAQTNPGFMAALESFAKGETKGGPLDVTPEDPGRTMTEPHTVMTDPGRTVAEQNQPSIAEFWEGTPSISRGAEQTNPFVSNPYADNPDVVSGRDQLAQDLQQSQQANPFGMQQDDSRAGVTQQQINEAYQAAQQARDNPDIPTPEQGRDPVAINPQDIPTPEQMQTARDVLTQQLQDAARGPTNQPSLDEFWEGIPAISRSQEETDRGRTVDPNIYPTMQELFDAREQQLAGRDFTAKEMQQERQSQLEQQRSDRDVELQDQRGLARGRDSVVAPSRGQERGTQFAPASRGQTQALGRGPGITSLGRGADRGTGRDSPGVQGLPAGLRGNEIAQALVSRGFDANLVGAALTIGDRGAMLTAMLEAAGLSHAQAVATANAARGAVEAQHGLPSNRR